MRNVFIHLILRYHVQVHSFSPSDRKRYVHLSQVSSECLQWSTFLSYFLRCNQRYSAFFRYIFLHCHVFAWLKCALTIISMFFFFLLFCCMLEQIKDHGTHSHTSFSWLFFFFFQVVGQKTPFGSHSVQQFMISFTRERDICFQILFQYLGK